MRTIKGSFLEIPELPESATLAERILLNRGVDPATVPDSFLSPDAADLHDPFLFPGMDAAVDRILKARENKERVVVFGDYDVDGVSSTAMLVRFFASVGIQVSFRLPHRVRDGYGMKPYFMDDLAKNGVGLVVSVDCGTRDVATVERAHELGIDVIVTDHHAVPDVVPEHVVALLNPKLPGTTYPFHSLAGAGVAFKLLSALAYRLFPTSEYVAHILEYVDFAALGTVADMMPLVGENRTIVSLGLKRIRSSHSAGLRRLAEGKDPVADLIGFHIGPRINAAGRMDDPLKALMLLLASDDRVDAFLTEIEDLNARRKSSTEFFLKDAMEVTDPSQAVAFYDSEDVDHGIIGLVAGRLCEAYGKPSIALKREDSKLVASCRAPEGFDMVAFLTEFREYFAAFGGHKQAAGFTIPADRFDEFRTKALERARELHGSAASVVKRIVVDAELSLANARESLVREVRELGPFGMAFPKPSFLFRGVRARVEPLGKDGKHFKFVAPGFSGKINAFGFGAFADRLAGREVFDLVCDVEIETWMGRTGIVLTVRDIVE